MRWSGIWKYASYNVGGLAGNIQRKDGVDNAKVENCIVENITFVRNKDLTYHDISNVTATFSRDDKGNEEFERVVSGNYASADKSSPQYYYGGYADYYISYGNSKYDPKVVDGNYYIANSEYSVNVGDR